MAAENFHIGFGNYDKSPEYYYLNDANPLKATNGRSDTILLNQLSLIDSIPITNVQYDEIINLELWTKDNLMHPLSFAATDSFFEVQVACE